MEHLPKKRGIYLVANLKSEKLCENLIFSIRQSGCTLPIRLIPFGGPGVQSKFILDNVEVYEHSRFPREAVEFTNELKTLLDCPQGFLYRFFALFGDWDEFIYSDNDIVALMNWEKMMDYLDEYDFVHADEEYITNGKFNYNDPAGLEKIFGKGALLSAFTAGHFAARRKDSLVTDMKKAVEWFRENPTIPIKHDQALMHVASLIGKWNILNLCRSKNWQSSWAGDYANPLAVILAIQKNGHQPISHIHYSGSKPTGTRAIEDLILSNISFSSRLKLLVVNGIKYLSGYTYLGSFKERAMRKLKSFSK